MDVVRDILDNQLIDRSHKKFGRVDGIVLEVCEGRPPRLAYLEVGWVTLARRLHARFGKWVAARVKKKAPDRPEALRIPWSQVRDLDIDITVDLEAEKIPVPAWERWVQAKILRRA